MGSRWPSLGSHLLLTSRYEASVLLLNPVVSSEQDQATHHLSVSQGTDGRASEMVEMSSQQRVSHDDVDIGPGISVSLTFSPPGSLGSGS